MNGREGNCLSMCRGGFFFLLFTSASGLACVFARRPSLKRSVVLLASFLQKLFQSKIFFFSTSVEFSHTCSCINSNAGGRCFRNECMDFGNFYPLEYSDNILHPYIYQRFRPENPLTFFRCFISNSGVHTELRTELFI